MPQSLCSSTYTSLLHKIARHIPRKRLDSKGFTIVELLVVIVIIAILTTLAVVLYNGVQIRAADTTLKSDLRNASKRLALDNVQNGTYPISAAAADGGAGLKKSPGTTYQYTYTSGDNSYCITAVSDKAGVAAYHISSTNGSIQDGPCAGHTGPIGGGGEESLIPNGGVVTTLAGSGTSGYLDGTGTTAQFKGNFGLGIDTSGTIYVADCGDHRVRKVTSSGVVTTLTGSGVQAGMSNFDGTGTTASFYCARDVAVDTSGNAYVSEFHGSRIRKITPAGVVTTLAGSYGQSYADGTGTSARFSNPAVFAVDSTGNVYVADNYNNNIRKVTPAGVVTTLAGSGSFGSSNGTGTAASFAYPGDLTIDSAGTLYVGDASNHRVRVVTSAGVVTTLAGSSSGYQDATGTAARFYYPSGITVDASGTVYVTDSTNPRIRKIR